MIITVKQIISLFPLLIIGTTIIVMMLSIAIRRNQLKHLFLTVIGIVLSIISLQIVWKQDAQDICQLLFIDHFSVFWMLLILVIALVSSILSYNWLLYSPSIQQHHDEFYLLLLISSMGGLLLTSTNHLVILYLGIEMISLPLFSLIGYSFIQKFSLEASIKYIVLSGVSSSFLLLGIALIYAKTGCLSFFEIHKILLNDVNSLHISTMLVSGIILMMVGFGFKASFVPFHFWVADIYQGSSYPVMMYLATSIKIAIMSVLIRFLLVFPEQYDFLFRIFLMGTICASILIGNLMAVKQRSIKRVLAYSSISQMGYLLISMLVLRNNSIALETIIIYLMSYSLAIIGVVAIIEVLSNFCIYKKDVDLLLLYRGIFWKHPSLAIAFTIMLLSLAGIPMTFGFVGKFYLFMLGVTNKLWYPVFFLMIGNVIGMFYYLRIMISFYLYPIPIQNDLFFNSFVSKNWVVTLNGMMICMVIFLILYLGLFPQFFISCTNFICSRCTIF